MVVSHLIDREHCSVNHNVFCVERGCAAAMVGDAVCLWLGLDCDTPYWSHSSNYQPGNKPCSLIDEVLSLLCSFKAEIKMNSCLTCQVSSGFHAATWI